MCRVLALPSIHRPDSAAQLTKLEADFLKKKIRLMALLVCVGPPQLLLWQFAAHYYLAFFFKYS